MRVPVLVGEQNPISNDVRYDLYPLPTNSAGGRLCRLVLGLRVTEYLRLFERRNLLRGGAWSQTDAMAAARLLLDGRPGAGFVLLGSKVSAAFSLQKLADFSTAERDGFRFLRLPHPSGRARQWNEPGAYDRARAALRLFLPPDVAARLRTVSERD